MTRPLDDPPAGARLRLALDLYGFGEAVMRENLRRRHPGATDDEIEARLRSWLSSRPGAEAGDAVGRPNPDRWPAR